MKHFFALSLTCVALAAQVETSATVWRVNNNPDYDPDFTDLQAAIDAAGDNDTIHVEASGVQYDAVVADRPLVYIGPGYKLSGALTDNPGLQANAVMATVHQMVLNSGAEGTVIHGLRLGAQGAGGALEINCSNVQVIGNWIWNSQNGIQFPAAGVISNILINRNYFSENTVMISQNSVAAQVFIDMIISNNYFTNGSTYVISFGGGNDAITNMTISHNIFDVTIANTAVFGAEIRDNIYTQASSAIPTALNYVHHNIAAGPSTLPGGVDENYNSVDMSTIFVGTGSDDARWQLLPGVSATYPASNGTERGMSGGALPYKPSGIPPVPAIYFIQSDTDALQGGTLNVTIGTRINN